MKDLNHNFSTHSDPHADSRKKRRHAKKSHTVHSDDGEGNWLVSYADMMTLLFGFFVLICAFSTPNASKMEQVKKSAAKSMNGKYEEPYKELSADIKKVLKEGNLNENDVKIEETDAGVVLTSNGTLFFDSGSVSLKDKAQNLVERLSGVIAKRAKDFHVIVEGHTDDSGVVSKIFPSNWELSAARASLVVRVLESKGFPHGQLRPVGLADTEPVAENRDKAGKPIALNQARNRRIVIRIEKELPPRSAKKDMSEY